METKDEKTDALIKTPNIIKKWKIDLVNFTPYISADVIDAIKSGIIVFRIGLKAKISTFKKNKKIKKLHSAARNAFLCISCLSNKIV
ncbi:MAG: hypothetical protein WBA54_11745 [Acidaminobacteraceae bacterium]